MRPSIVGACALLALGPLWAAAAADARKGQGAAVVPNAAAATPHRLADPSSAGLGEQLIARWEKSLRQVRGWDDGAIAHFRRELAGMPSDTLKQALAVGNWDTLQAILMSQQGEAAVARLAAAVQDWRSGASLDESNVEEAQFKAGIAKALGDADKDLIFVPIQPCTVWDTRFAQPGPHAGQIGPTANRPAYVYVASAGAYNWSPYGGNPSCTDTSVVANYGVIPYAVAYTLYTADATANGWITAYRDGDADPSSATISLYYTPGPTRSTTMITRVGRAAAGTYDIRVASQFGSVHVAASVIGYFLRSAATMLECNDVSSGSIVVPAGEYRSRIAACGAGYRLTGGACTNVYDAGSLVIDSSFSIDWYLCYGKNISGIAQTLNATGRCCRIPGR